MRNYYFNVHFIWLALMLLTVVSYFVGETSSSGVVIMTFLLLVACAKGSFVINDFMGLRDVSFLWRAIMFGWLWVVCLSLSGIYFFSI